MLQFSCTFAFLSTFRLLAIFGHTLKFYCLPRVFDRPSPQGYSRRIRRL